MRERSERIATWLFPQSGFGKLLLLVSVTELTLLVILENGFWRNSELASFERLGITVLCASIWSSVAWMVRWYRAFLNTTTHYRNVLKWLSYFVTSTVTSAIACFYLASWVFFLRCDVFPDFEAYEFGVVNFEMIWRYLWQSEQLVACVWVFVFLATFLVTLRACCTDRGWDRTQIERKPIDPDDSVVSAGQATTRWLVVPPDRRDRHRTPSELHRTQNTAPWWVGVVVICVTVDVAGLLLVHASASAKSKKRYWEAAGHSLEYELRYRANPLLAVGFSLLAPQKDDGVDGSLSPDELGPPRSVDYDPVAQIVSRPSRLATGMAKNDADTQDVSASAGTVRRWFRSRIPVSLVLLRRPVSRVSLTMA